MKCIVMYDYYNNHCTFIEFILYRIGLFRCMQLLFYIEHSILGINLLLVYCFWTVGIYFKKQDISCVAFSYSFCFIFSDLK